MYATYLFSLFVWFVLAEYGDAQHPTCEGIYKIQPKGNKIIASFNATLSLEKLVIRGLSIELTYIFDALPITEQDMPDFYLADKEFYFDGRASQDSYFHLVGEVHFGRNLGNVGEIIIRYANETVAVMCRNVEELDSGKIQVKVIEHFRNELAITDVFDDDDVYTVDQPQTILQCEIKDHLLFRYCLLRNVVLNDESNVIIQDDNGLDQVNILDIRGRVERLSAVFCEKFPNLMGFEASHVKLRVIDDNAFHKCIKLKKLNLIGNKLTDVPPVLFEKGSKLQVLDLHENNLESIMLAEILRLLPNLQILNLQGNQLHENHFNVSAFPVMKHLWHLDLRAFMHVDPERGVMYSIPSDFATEMFLEKFPSLGQLDLVEKDFRSAEVNAVTEFFTKHSVKCCNSDTYIRSGI